MSSPAEITRLLVAWGKGDEAALERLLPLIHRELHRLARQHMRGERAGHVLQTTALVNEAYLRLVEAQDVAWRDRTHFFAVSARIMRRILIDFARARRNLKRGGGERRVALDEAALVTPAPKTDLLALDEALDRLAALHPRPARVVELRYFGGLNEDEAAEALNVSPRTVRHDWSLAKAWLYREMSQ